MKTILSFINTLFLIGLYIGIKSQGGAQVTYDRDGKKFFFPISKVLPGSDGTCQKIEELCCMVFSDRRVTERLSRLEVMCNDTFTGCVCEANSINPRTTKAKMAQTTGTEGIIGTTMLHKSARSHFQFMIYLLLLFKSVLLLMNAVIAIN